MTVPASVALNAYANAARSAATGASGQANDVSLGDGQQAFGDVLRGVMDTAIATGVNSEQQTVATVAGQGDIVNVVTAVAEAEATLQTVVAVRDKVLTAYQEIIKMPI